MRAFAQVVLPPIIRIAEVITAVFLFLMMMLTFVDVIGRYIFTAPVFGAAEMIQFLLAMTIFGGLCLINARDEHIAVELFEKPLDRWFPTIRRIIIQLFSVGVMTIIAVELLRFAFDAYRISSRTIVLEWPLVVVAGGVAGLSILSLFAQVLGLILPPPPSAAQDRGDL